MAAPICTYVCATQGARFKPAMGTRGPSRSQFCGHVLAVNSNFLWSRHSAPRPPPG
jgi:hypothetical protein